MAELKVRSVELAFLAWCWDRAREMGDLAKGAEMVRVDVVGVGAAGGIWATT